MSSLIKAAVTVQYGILGRGQNVFWYRRNGTNDPTNPITAGEIRDDLEAQLGLAYSRVAGHMPNNVTAGALDVWYWDGVSIPVNVVNIAAGDVATSGTLTGTEVAAHGVALLLKAYGTLGGRPALKYIGGLAEAEFATGTVTGTLLVNALLMAQDIYKEFVGTASGASYTPMVVNETTGVAREVDATFGVGLYAAYQRRRKPGVGF